MRQGHRSISNFGLTVVDIRDLTLQSAANSNKSHYQSKVFVCVSVIRGHVQIIAWMRSISFKFDVVLVPDNVLHYNSMTLVVIQGVLTSFQKSKIETNICFVSIEQVLQLDHLNSRRFPSSLNCFISSLYNWYILNAQNIPEFQIILIICQINFLVRSPDLSYVISGGDAPPGQPRIVHQDLHRSVVSN